MTDKEEVDQDLMYYREAFRSSLLWAAVLSGVIALIAWFA